MSQSYLPSKTYDQDTWLNLFLNSTSSFLRDDDIQLLWRLDLPDYRRQGGP